MRRHSIALALSTLLLVSICSAQQKSGKEDANSGQNTSPIGGNGTAVIGGAGAANYIPIWTTPNYLQSSVIYQANGGNVGIGTTTPVATLDVNGGINAATTYQIGGSTVLNIGNPADFNVFLGVDAGATAGYGANTFLGYRAGFMNSVGAYQNTFVGSEAGVLNKTGILNTFLGYQAGFDNNTSSGNTFLGYQAGFDRGGSFNTYIGFRAGMFASGSSNIYIGFGGTGFPESNAIRIGDSGEQTAAYIVGIYGSTSFGGIPVYIGPDGKLGTQTSSLRFKEQVRDMGDSTNALMELRPVTFLYKPEYENGERRLQYGLIAEEVANVYPELVAYDNDGQPYSVRYQYIATMLLNEVQKQYRRAEAEAKVITAQEDKIEQLEQRLSRLERLVPQTVAQK